MDPLNISMSSFQKISSEKQMICQMFNKVMQNDCINIFQVISKLQQTSTDAQVFPSQDASIKRQHADRRAYCTVESVTCKRAPLHSETQEILFNPRQQKNRNTQVLKLITVFCNCRPTTSLCIHYQKLVKLQKASVTMPYILLTKGEIKGTKILQVSKNCQAAFYTEKKLSSVGRQVVNIWQGRRCRHQHTHFTLKSSYPHAKQ